MIKQNFKILISILCLLQFAVTVQAAQARRLARICDVIRALPKGRMPAQQPPAPKMAVPKQVVPQQFQVPFVGFDPAQTIMAPKQVMPKILPPVQQPPAPKRPHVQFVGFEPNQTVQVVPKAMPAQPPAASWGSSLLNIFRRRPEPTRDQVLMAGQADRLLDDIMIFEIMLHFERNVERQEHLKNLIRKNERALGALNVQATQVQAKGQLRRVILPEAVLDQIQETVRNSGDGKRLLNEVMNLQSMLSIEEDLERQQYFKAVIQAYRETIQYAPQFQNVVNDLRNRFAPERFLEELKQRFYRARIRFVQLIDERERLQNYVDMAILRDEIQKLQEVVAQSY
ncbi:hypothetical protein A3J41_00145 [candidate division TM6 bacterium RIFCSPHIGHO2_12_FULL_38_8]|nr:MAG: hypothetical protein A3J41_00145 [candidate division TM6 bacterium RIFCSPHIGHO2_12_FULL_38_8]